MDHNISAVLLSQLSDRNLKDALPNTNGRKIIAFHKKLTFFRYYSRFNVKVNVKNTIDPIILNKIRLRSNTMKFAMANQANTNENSANLNETREKEQ